MTSTSSPAKRVLTEDARIANSATDSYNDALTPDLAARLRSVGARVRKTVSEGYGTLASTPPDSSQKKQQHVVSTNGLIFQSGRDTLRHVYSDYVCIGHKAPTSTPNKRQRAMTEEPESDEGSKSDVEMKPFDELNEHELPSFTGLDALSRGSRPIRPLKRSARALAQTRSLPAVSFRFSNESPASVRSPNVGAKSTEDDWSEDPSFDGATQPLKFDMDF